jgi:hypothetical protein
MRRITIDNLNKKEIGYILGLYTGDGYSNYSKKDRHYRVDFYLDATNDLDIIDKLENYLVQISLNPYQVKCRGSIRVSVNSKAFKDFVENYDLSREFKDADFLLGFISGFIDSDGYVAKGDIVITQKDKAILEEVSNSCKLRFGIKTRLWQRKTRYKSPFYVWNFRIATPFRHLAHISCKIQRIYGGARASALRSEK